MMRWLFAAFGLVTCVAAAAAADLPPPPGAYYKAPPYAAPYYNWTGFYVGVNGGGAFGTSAWDTTSSFSLTGGQVGGTIGYNYQMGWAVLGAEGDIDWSSIKGTTTTGACPAGCTTSDSWLSTLRARFGYAADRFMPYVTGGGAFGNVDATTATPGLAGGSATNVGWTVGAGLEYAITPRWSAKVEYLFVDLGKFNCGAGCGATTDNVSFTTSLVRGGVNFHF
jgi:outer membrane immunogenic protein